METKMREKVSVSLLLLVATSLCSTVFLGIRRYMIGSYVSDFRRGLSLVTNSPSSRVLGGDMRDMKNVDTGDFVIFNVLALDDRGYLNNVWLTKYFLGKYSNVSVYNIILDGDATANAGAPNDSGAAVDKFLLKYNMNNLTICSGRDILRKYLGIGDANRIVVTDRRYVVRGIFDANVGVSFLEKFLSDVGKTKVIYDRSRVGGRRRFTDKADEYLINSMEKVAVVENFNGMATPVLAILDSYAKRLLIAKFSGEILYIVESKSFCLPRGIKYSDGKLFVLDSCDGSIGYLDFNEQRFLVSGGGEYLRGATDFELLGDSVQVFSRADGGPMINFLVGDNVSNPKEMDPTGKVNSIRRFNDYFYYLDSKNRIIHSIKDGVDRVAVDLNKIGGIDERAEILSFYINRENDIYLADLNGRIFRCYDYKCSKQSLQSQPYQPNDLVLYKNLMFVLFDRYIQLSDTYSSETSKIIPYVSENTRYISDTINDLDLVDIDYIGDPDLFGTAYFTGMDRTRLLNPSFLTFLGDYDGRLLVEKFVNREGLANDQNMYFTYGSGSIVYGKLYYEDSGEIRVRTVLSRLAEHGAGY